MATTVTLLANGPLKVEGEVQLQDAEGKTLPGRALPMYLCRCGASAQKPFCDGTHKKVEFRG